jgi:23S rRNA (uridine2552-2'-O)-methyltransferase
VVGSGKKLSSARWLQRHAGDPFVAKRIKDGYRSRAAYKLLEIDEKYRIFSSGMSVADLGAAPGGWSQVAVAKVGSGGRVWAFDLLPMDPLSGVDFQQGDFTQIDLQNVSVLDLVLSDMAPNFSGDHETDHVRSIRLSEHALDFAVAKLRKGGCLVLKVIVGSAEADLVHNIKQRFNKVDRFKPKSSRSESSELYVVAKGFRA